MTAGTFTPRPGSASLGRMVRAQAGMEARLMLRNGEQLLIALVIPVLVLVGGVWGSQRLDAEFGAPAVDVLTPGVLALAVMSTSFTSLAIATGFERRYGLIKRLGASPLPRLGLLAGKVGALLCIQVMQLVVLSAVGLLLGWSPTLSVTSVLFAGLLVVLGTAAFASLGLLMAGTLRAEATLAAANLVYLLLLAGGAVVIPASAYGASYNPLLHLLPSGALGEGLRGALLGGTLDLRYAAVLLAWTLVGGAAAARWFKWE